MSRRVLPGRDPEPLRGPDQDHVPRPLKITSCVLCLLLWHEWGDNAAFSHHRSGYPSVSHSARLPASRFLASASQHVKQSQSVRCDFILSFFLFLFPRILDCSSAPLVVHLIGSTDVGWLRVSHRLQRWNQIFCLSLGLSSWSRRGSQPSGTAANLWTRFSSPRHYLQALPGAREPLLSSSMPFFCVWVCLTAALAIFSPFSFSLDILE